MKHLLLHIWMALLRILPHRHMNFYREDIGHIQCCYTSMRLPILAVSYRVSEKSTPWQVDPGKLTELLECNSYIEAMKLVRSD